MASCSSCAQLSSILFMIWFLGFARSDFASDRNECATQLVGLATCLPYVQGQAKAPTPDCCSGLKQVVAKSRKCLCVLVKDRDDPNLGLKFNATLALMLPASCSAPLNVSECIDLLHLSPNSTEAQVFKQFESSLERNNSTTTTIAKANSTSTSGTSAAVKRYGASEEGVVGDVGVVGWIWCMISLNQLNAWLVWRTVYGLLFTILF